MTNGDYNPPPHPTHLENDRRQARITFIGLSIAAVVVVRDLDLAHAQVRGLK